MGFYLIDLQYTICLVNLAITNCASGRTIMFFMRIMFFMSIYNNW